MVIAHRGIHNNLDVPENSFLAFQKCLDKGIAIELDVQLTSDNELVVFHDYDLSRMTGANAVIEELSLDEIRKLNLLNTDERIPTLQEILNLVNGKVLIDIEIKDTKRFKEVSNKLLEILSLYKGNVIIKSFSPRIIRYLRKHNPNYTYGLLLMKKYSNKIKTLIMNSNLVLLYCRPNFLAISKGLAKTKKFKKLRNKYPIYIWTFNSLDEIEKYKNCGNNYICNLLP